ncbi:MAG: hypothetical protein IPI63_08570 [Methanothrix sp.]|uniref:hypothetical protein n=2 Tax=Methanothrix sp. TaxID=90426 RepID=UPI0025F0E37E|nr:hypothetical protein [Methanothrix sp.]MBK7386762.1 hypothetical protein [Methanothrix sp.]
MRMMDNKASIDAIYDLVERAEQKKKRLTLTIIAVSISSLLGISIDAFALMAFLNRKGDMDAAIILLIVVISAISVILALQAGRRFLVLKRLNQNLGPIGELEETIYNEVLRHNIDN